MHHLPFHIPAGAVMFAVGDPERDRTVYAAIVLLVALGFTMIMLAVWLFRNTRPDPEVLAPLERMGERKWRRADPVWQRRRLDEVRPGGADPLEPTSAPPATDADFERGPQPIGFDDLVVSNPAAVTVASELPAPTAGAIAAEGPAPHGGDASAPVIERDDDDGDDRDDDDADGEDDDDEDITGEQDTDDFLAATGPRSDLGDNTDSDTDTDPEDSAGEDVAVEAAAVEDDEPDEGGVPSNYGHA